MPVLFLSPQRPFAFAGTPYWEHNPPAGAYLLSSCFLWFCYPPAFVFRVPNPLFFALCAVFRGGVGYLPYLREENGTQPGQRLLLFFTVCGVCCFAGVFSATNRDFPSAATTFRILFQYRRRSRTVSLLHFRCCCVTDWIFIKNQLPQSLLRCCDTCDTFWSGACIPDAFCLFPVEIDHTFLLIADAQRAGILRGTGLNQSFLCHSFQKTLG